MILNFLKFNIISFNLLIIIWTNLCFNVYRLELEETFQTPTNLYYNRWFFLMILNCYISSLSFLTVVFNMGREEEYKKYYIINLISSVTIGVIDYIEYENCDTRCRDLLGRNNLYDADILAKYLSLFNLFLTIEYLSLGLFYYLYRSLEEPIQFNSLYAEQITQTDTPTGMVSPVENNEQFQGKLTFTKKRVAVL